MRTLSFKPDALLTQRLSDLATSSSQDLGVLDSYSLLYCGQTKNIMTTTYPFQILQDYNFVQVYKLCIIMKRQLQIFYDIQDSNIKVKYSDSQQTANSPAPPNHNFVFNQDPTQKVGQCSSMRMHGIVYGLNMVFCQQSSGRLQRATCHPVSI